MPKEEEYKAARKTWNVILKMQKKGMFSEENAILSSECTHVPVSHLI